MERPGCHHRRLRTRGDTGADGTGPRVQVRRAAAGSARRRPAEAGGARNGRGGPARVTTKRLRGLLAHPDPPKIRRRPGRALRAATAASIPRPSFSTKPSVRRRPQVQDAHVHLWRRVPLRPGPLLLRARRGRAAAAAGAVVAARVQDEALPLRRFRVPLLRRRPLPVRAHGPRAGVPRLRPESRACDDASRRERRRRRPRATTRRADGVDSLDTSNAATTRRADGEGLARRRRL